MEKRLLGGLFVCLFPFLFFLFMLGGILLRTVCSLLQVRPPDLLPATGMAFFVTLLIGLLTYLLYSLLVPHLNTQAVSKEAFVLVSLGLSVILTMFVGAGLYTGTLPEVGYGKGLAIYWIQVGLFIGLVLVILICGAVTVQVVAGLLP